MHAIHVRAVPEHLVIVNVILCYQYIARDIVDPVVAESVDLVAGEQHIVRHDFRAEYDLGNVRVRHRNAGCVGSVIGAFGGNADHAGARQPLRLGPSIRVVS